jgi:hypothetical protein
MSAQTSGSAPSEAMSSTLTACVQQAIDALDRALGEPPSVLTQDVDVAERAIAEARDELIRDLRQPSLRADTSGRRRNLNELNVALSLVVGVEYPAAGIQRKLLEQARDVLRNLLASAP